jgi:hypothetical protein
MLPQALRLTWTRKMDDDTKDRRDAEIEARAAAAFTRIRDGNHWADWMFLADGLMLGRRGAMDKARTQEPKGKGYILAFSRWMETRPWARDLDSPTRNDLFWCAEHRSEIEAWRDELPAEERAKKNHPTHMKRSYLAAHKPEKTDKPDEAAGDAKDKAERALRDDNFHLRGDLAKERDDHGKTKRDLKEAYVNPLTVWQTNPQDAALKLFHDNPPRAEAILRALAALFGLTLVNVADPAPTPAPGRPARKSDGDKIFRGRKRKPSVDADGDKLFRSRRRKRAAAPKPTAASEAPKSTEKLEDEDAH